MSAQASYFCPSFIFLPKLERGRIKQRSQMLPQNLKINATPVGDCFNVKRVNNIFILALAHWLKGLSDSSTFSQVPLLKFPRFKGWAQMNPSLDTIIRFDWEHFSLTTRYFKKKKKRKTFLICLTIEEEPCGCCFPSIKHTLGFLWKSPSEIYF